MHSTLGGVHSQDMNSLLTFGVAVAIGVIGSVAYCQSAADCSEQTDAQVLILGAGFAGLSTARTLAQNGIDDFLIIERLNRIGGRALSERFAGGTVDLGPQWVLNIDRNAPEDVQHPFNPLIERCNISLRNLPLGALGFAHYNDKGEDISEQWNEANARYSLALATETVSMVLDNLEEHEDIPMQSGLRAGQWFPTNSIEASVEYTRFDIAVARPTDAASYRSNTDPKLLLPSATAFGPNPFGYIVNDPRGYTGIAQCIADDYLAPDDPRLLLGTFVTTIQWSDDCICVLTEKDGSEQRYCAPYGILTFSAGALQSGLIKFEPDLPVEKFIALHKREMANFLKIYFSFNETFWDTGVDFITYADEVNGPEYYPIWTPWGAFQPGAPPIFEVYLTAKTARRVARQDEELTKQQAAQVLRNIYGDKASDPVDMTMHNFTIDPYFNGNFAHNIPTGFQRAIEELNHPLGRLYFAGEGYTLIHHSVAHGAYLHGVRTAERIIQKIQAPLGVIFINDSPRVENNAISAEFRFSRSVSSVLCNMSPGGMRVDCSSGQVTFSDLADGTYQLRVIARNEERGERAVANRRLVVNSNPHCTVHLINEGVFVDRSRATIEFSSSGIEVTGYTCSLDFQNDSPCSSPLVLRGLSAGQHRVRITPQCGGSSEQQRTVSFSV